MEYGLGLLVFVVIVDALIVGPLTAWLADERGRDPLPWFVLGAVVGPLALITVGFGPRKVGQTFKACIECQEPIGREATTCPFCRTDLLEAEAAERRSPRSTAPMADS